MVGTGSGIVDIQCRIDFNADGVAALVAAATSPAPAINTSNNNTSAASIRSAQSRDLTHFPASHPSYSPHTDWYSTLAPRFPSGAHPHLSAHRPIPAFMLPNTVPNAPSHPHPPNAPSASYAGLTPQYIPQQQHAPLSPPKVKDYSLAGSLNLSSALAPPFSPTTSSTPNTPGALQHIAIASLSLVLYSGAFPISTPGGLPANGGPLNWLDMVTMAGHVHKVPFGARVVHLVTKPTVCKSATTFPFKFTLPKNHPPTIVQQETNVEMGGDVLTGTSNFMFVIVKYRTAGASQWRTHVDGFEVLLQQYQVWAQEKMLSVVYRIPYQITEIKARVTMKKYCSLFTDPSNLPTMNLEISDWDRRIRVISAKCIWGEEVLHMPRLSDIISDSPTIREQDSAWLINQLFADAKPRFREIARTEIKIDPWYPHYSHSQLRQPAKPPFKYDFAVPWHLMRGGTANYRRGTSSGARTTSSAGSVHSGVGAGGMAGDHASESPIVAIRHSVRVILEFSPDPFEVVVPIEFHPELTVPLVGFYGPPPYNEPQPPSLGEYGRSLSDNSGTIAAAQMLAAARAHQQSRPQQGHPSLAPRVQPPPAASISSATTLTANGTIMSTRARSSMRPGSVSSTVVGSMDANSGASSSIGVGTTARFKGLFKGRRESDASVGALTTQSEPTPSLFGSLRRGGTNQTIASGVPSTALPPSPAFVPSSPPTPLSPTFTPSTARDTMPQKATWRSSILSMSRFSMASAPSVILDGGTESSTGRDVDTDTATDFFASVVAKPGPDTVRVGADNESSRSSLLASNASVLDFNNEYGGSERAVSSLGFAEGGGFVASPPPPPPQRLQPMAGPWNMDSSPRARSPLAMVAGMVPGSVQNGAFRAVADNFCLEDSAFPGITAYEYLECKSGEVVVVLDVGDIPGLLWCENFQTRKSGFVPERKLDMLHPVSLTNRRGF